MQKFLILQADYPCGRGARGLNLYRFLTTYHGRRAVRMISTRELLEGGPHEAEVVFIGVPTQFSRRHLDRLDFRQAVLFDYQDAPGPTWLDSDESLLRSLTDQYLKPWVEPTWDYGLRIGVLPIRRHYQLKLCLQCRAGLSGLGLGGAERRYDVAFVGEATECEDRLPQRIEWLREIKQAGPRYSFWGGIATRPQSRARLEQKFADFAELCYPAGRVGFFTYFAHLSRSRVALAPAGNARWSYRHYEAIYAGAVVVSTDFRRIATLIPLPLERMVHVEDQGSVIPAIDEALALRRAHPELPEENIRFLEGFLHNGDYCRKKPALMERFLAQLAGPSRPQNQNLLQVAPI